MTVNYGKERWIGLAFACLACLCSGSIYAWSVFANPLAEYIAGISGVQAASLSIVFTVANSVGPITMIGCGFINDKIGSRWILIIGGVMLGAGMVFAGLSKSVAGLVISYGLGFGLAIGMIYGTMVSSAVKMFPDKRGLVGGITTAANGLSSVILSPIANSLISALGVNRALIILGCVMGSFVLAASFIFPVCFDKTMNRIRNLPSLAAPSAGYASKNQEISGTAPAPSDSTAVSGAVSGTVSDSVPSRTGEKNWRQMLSTPYFYAMFAMLCCGAFSGLMITSKASPLAQTIMNFTPAAAAVLVSVLAVFNTLGRIISGMVSDRIGIIKSLHATFVCFFAGQLLLFFSSESGSLLFAAGICLVGLSFGAIMGMYPSFTSKTFGLKHNSVNYGIMFCSFAFAGFLGPRILDSIGAASGSYRYAFLTGAAFAAAGFVISLTAKKR